MKVTPNIMNMVQTRIAYCCVYIHFNFRIADIINGVD